MFPNQKAKTLFDFSRAPPRRWAPYYILIIKLRLKLIIITILLCRRRRQIAMTFLRFLSPRGSLGARPLPILNSGYNTYIPYLQLWLLRSRVTTAIILYPRPVLPRVHPLDIISFYPVSLLLPFVNPEIYIVLITIIFPPHFVFWHTRRRRRPSDPTYYYSFVYT